MILDFRPYTDTTGMIRILGAFAVSWILGNWIYDQSIALIPEIKPLAEEVTELLRLPTHQQAGYLFARARNETKWLSSKREIRDRNPDIYQMLSGDDIFISKTNDSL